jgi:ribosomal protein S27AE
MRYKLRFAAKNPEKVKAHRIVASAKRRGDLVPGPCIRCGADNAHAHHEDYSKPLEVTWLCRRCHNQEHSGPRKTAWGKPATKNGGKKRAPGQFYWRGKLRYASPTPGPVRR